MSTLIDPTICPDCRAPLGADKTCTGCGLVLAGPLASQLWATLVTADGLITRLRESANTAALKPLLAPLVAPLPAYPMPTTAAPRRRLLPAASVPVVLLSLGALCLLVASVVFVAVAWGSLGLGAKTTILLAVTGLFTAAAVTLTRRDLRGSAEALWLIAAGMLSVDLIAAHTSGLLGLDALSWRGASALVGGAELLMGAGVALWARTQPVQRLYGVQGVAALGTFVIVSTNVWSADHPEARLLVAVPLLAALAYLSRAQLPITSYGVAAVGGISWLALVALGLDRAGELDTQAAWWSGVQGWPLLVAAAFAAALALLDRLPRYVRITAAALSLTVVAAFVFGPSTGGTRDLLTLCGLLAAAAVASRFGLSVWSPAAGALTAIGAVPALLLLVGDALFVAGNAREGQHGTLRFGLGTVLRGEFDRSGAPAPWVWIVLALAVLAAAWGLLAHTSSRIAGSVARASAVGVLGVGVGTFVVRSGVAVWASTLALTLLGLAAAAVVVRLRDERPALLTALGASAYLLMLATVVGSASWLASGLLATLLVLALAAGYVWLRPDVVLVGFAVLLTAEAAHATFSWSQVIRFLDPTTQSLTVALTAAAVGVLATRIGRTPASRLGFEVTSLLVGGLALTLQDSDAVAAIIVTIIGTAICIVSVTNEDRDLLGWGGAAVLAIALVIRIDLDVAAPELYTLPAAALLLAAGVWRLQVDPQIESLRALGSGLTLALLPSLLIALDEPLSLRGAMIAAAGVSALAIGVRQRWSAPFVAGAVTTGVLAVRHLEPVLDGAPRWLSLGAVGLALLIVGVTWEQRRRNVDVASRYLAALR